MIGILRKVAIAALLLLAGNAFALGLGQIQVKSRINQPLLAEIPIISTTPGELAALRARMASPETFRRIGLPPPTGAAADLQFSLGSDARGRPVIRVTSIRPVDQAMVNFLIEVDWGEGKLVREYSAVIDAPNTANAPVVQADVQMPSVPAPNLVQRPLAPDDPSAATAPEAATEPPVPADSATGAAAPVATAAEPEVADASIDVAAAPVAPPPPSALASPLAAGAEESQYGPVKRGETLSRIVAGLGLGADLSPNQTMLALLRANPEAFLNDNINRLRQGAVLRVPGAGEVAQIDATEANVVVRQQMQAWRQAPRAVLQPEAASAGNARALRPGVNRMALRPGAAVMPPGSPIASAAAGGNAAVGGAEARRAEARLEIVPPAGARATSADTGTGSGRGGSMLQQELRQRDEEIASKSAEIGELKERVAELERLRNEQSQLLTMKDTELAAAQHRLAQANQTTAQSAAAGSEAAPPPAASSNGMYYLGGGLGLLLVGLLVWFFSKRRAAPVAPVRAFDHDALAASMQKVGRRFADASPTVRASAAERAAVAPKPAAPPPAAEDSPRKGVPAWHSGWVAKESTPRNGAPERSAPRGPAPSPAAPTVTPTTPAPAADAGTASAAGAPARASAEQRFKLVDAFLDMGDRTSAQQLLAELLNDENDAVSEKAGKMLARIMG